MSSRGGFGSDTAAPVTVKTNSCRGRGGFRPQELKSVSPPANSESIGYFSLDRSVCSENVFVNRELKRTEQYDNSPPYSNGFGRQNVGFTLRNTINLNRLAPTSVGYSTKLNNYASNFENRYQLVRFVADRFNDLNYSDLIVETTDGQKFSVLKIVLSAYSSIFQIMFEGPESRTKTIRIHDLDPKAVELMLNFMYTGKVEDSSRLNFALFTAADRYDLEDLKNLCIQNITSKITLETVLEGLKLSFNDIRFANFKVRVVDFTFKNLREIVKLSKWNQFASQNVPIITELLLQNRSFGF